jgi:glutamate mutase epsilon subunit
MNWHNKQDQQQTTQANKNMDDMLFTDSQQFHTTLYIHKACPLVVHNTKHQAHILSQIHSGMGIGRGSADMKIKSA